MVTNERVSGKSKEANVVVWDKEKMVIKWKGVLIPCVTFWMIAQKIDDLSRALTIFPDKVLAEDRNAYVKFLTEAGETLCSYVKEIPSVEAFQESGCLSIALTRFCACGGVNRDEIRMYLEKIVRYLLLAQVFKRDNDPGHADTGSKDAPAAGGRREGDPK